MLVLTGLLRFVLKMLDALVFGRILPAKQGMPVGMAVSPWCSATGPVWSPQNPKKGQEPCQP